MYNRNDTFWEWRCKDSGSEFETSLNWNAHALISSRMHDKWSNLIFSDAFKLNIFFRYLFSPVKSRNGVPDFKCPWIEIIIYLRDIRILLRFTFTPTQPSLWLTGQNKQSAHVSCYRTNKFLDVFVPSLVHNLVYLQVYLLWYDFII